MGEVRKRDAVYWIRYYHIPHVDDVVVLERGAAAAAGRRVCWRPVGHRFATLHEADSRQHVRAFTHRAGRQSVDASPNLLQHIAHR